ncbi:hypothetical protein F7725_013363 [Dissostichus mawsoni]|uniref:Rab-like protein 6 n=1 Tax=Dissostichus mawsoni TaxID=36200 RepID=A0A7J5YRP6_DISMA|nr:hypothetical protein F7725_013363 [Dissostichus mawsoni]
MFSAFKKLVGSEPGQLRDKNIPAGLQSMNQSLQRRFAKGVQYNMKIVIRGDRNTGKSTLWHRLQGKKFVEEYLPTQEIQATSIHWNYKTTDDVVKVEVWDVVDKGKGKKRGENLKLENEPQESDEVALDAEFLDVYKNCNGIIMMFDITKQWTFNYILRELPKVPTHVPVCVLGNHRDMGEHRVILPDDIRDLIAGLNRPMGASYIHYAESSMKNGFGLKYLHRFFNIPFLQLQRETLLRQLETNQLDMDATLEELCVQQETEDQNYEIFLENLESRVKALALPVQLTVRVPPPAPSPPSSPPAEPLQAAPAPAPLNPRYPPRCSPSHQLCPPPSLHLRPRLLLLLSQSLRPSLPMTFRPRLRPELRAPRNTSLLLRDGEGRGNPMVSAFQDELDPDDTEPSLPQPKSLPLRKDVALTSDEEAPPVTQDQDLDSEPELKAPVIHIPKLKVASKAPEAISLTLTPAAEQLPRQQAKKKGSSPRAEDSDTDPEAPAAHQMLSFIMDDPDFESEASDTPKVTKDIFPVRDELLSDLSDDDLQVSKAKEPLKPTPISFKHKDDTDLFGLGFQEDAPAAKESSEEQEGKEKEEENQRGGREKQEETQTQEKEKDEGAAGDEKEKKKKPSRSKKTEVDDLEDFLGGGAASVKRDDGDYEEL